MRRLFFASHVGVTLHQAGVGVSDEAEHLFALVGMTVMLLDFLNGVRDAETFLEHKAVDIGDIVDALTRKAATLQSE